MVHTSYRRLGGEGNKQENTKEFEKRHEFRGRVVFERACKLGERGCPDTDRPMLLDHQGTSTSKHVGREQKRKHF